MSELTHILTACASHAHPMCVTGIGVVIRERHESNRLGPVVVRICESYRHVALYSAEAFAIWRGLNIALERGYTHLIVQAYYSPGGRARRVKRSIGFAIDDPLDARIQELSRRFATVRFGLPPRQKNQLARKLARAARNAQPRTPTDQECPEARLLLERCEEAHATVFTDSTEGDFLEPILGYDETFDDPADDDTYVRDEEIPF